MQFTEGEKEAKIRNNCLKSKTQDLTQKIHKTTHICQSMFLELIQVINFLLRVACMQGRILK